LFYSWKFAKKSQLILYAGGSILLQLPANLVSKLRHKPIVFDYLDIEVEKIPKCVYKKMLRSITGIFAISHYLDDMARSYGCKNVVYVPAVVDPYLFQTNILARDRLRSEWGFTGSHIVIGYAGALSYTEGISVLLHSFKNVSIQHPEIRLRILGTKQVSGQGDELFLVIKELDLEDKLSFVPPVMHNEVPGFLSACDILCAPKIDCDINRAANPIKVIEYLSMGIPTICSSVGEVSRIITHGVDGFLAIPGEVGDLEEKLEWIVRNPNQAKEIGKNGRNMVMEKYSCQAIGNVVFEFLDNITAGEFRRVMVQGHQR